MGRAWGLAPQMSNYPPKPSTAKHLEQRILSLVGMPRPRMRMSRPISPNLILTLKLVAILASLERSEKDGQVGNLRLNTIMMKIGLADPQIALLKYK